MKQYRYLDEFGTFQLEDPECTNYLYFPIANESGVMSSVTPLLGGDSKLSQHHFLLQPVSSEDLHNNKSTRNFWISIHGEEPWSATGVSARQQAEIFRDSKEKTTLEAGIMWHKLSRYNKELGLSSTITSFVPSSGETVELMKVDIKNNSNRTITFTPTAAIPIYGRSADNIRDHRHVTSLLHRIKTCENGVLVQPTLAFDERGHQKNQTIYGVFGKSDKEDSPVGFYPVVEDFIGAGGTLENPEAIMKSDIHFVKSGCEVHGYEALGGLRFADVTLREGEISTYIIALAYGEGDKDLEAMIDKLLSKQDFDNSLQETKEYWKNKINVSYHSGNECFDRWMYWVNFQPMLRRIYGCSFLPHHDYGKGGRGWRDLWQDCLALLVMQPEGVRELILNNFAGVRIDGSNATIIGSKPGEFIADRNNITRVWMDHGVWPLMTTKLYIEHSDDIDLLLEKTSYFKDTQTHRGEGKDDSWSEEKGKKLLTEDGAQYQGTILEHLLLQNLTAFYDVGEHNHIRLRGADWNDALDMAVERGESVAFTSAYARNLLDLADLIDILSVNKGIKTVSIASEMEILLQDSQELYDDINSKMKLLEEYYDKTGCAIIGNQISISCSDLSKNLRNKSEWIKNHIRKAEWITDNRGHSWFNGYYDNHGRQVEGEHPLGVRMMLTSQVFAIMSETATKEQTIDIINAANQYLYCEEIGGYRLNSDFKEVKTDLGRMFGFAYGHKENGAVFSHMTVMYANALYQRGFAVEAYKVIDSLFQHLSSFEKSKVYPGITEYINEKGTGMYHYLTGSASWLLLTVLTEMYGVKGRYGDLVLEPKLVSSQFDKSDLASVNFTFRNRNFKVEYFNPEKKEFGDYSIQRIIVNDVLYRENSNILEKYFIDELEKDQMNRIIVYLF